MIRNWRDISYLEHGTARQREAFDCLHVLGVLNVLREFDPIVVSTVCLDIDTPASDIDIICEVHDSSSFKALLERHFSQLRGFTIRSTQSAADGIVCQFFTDDFEIEIFGQAVPTEQQNAYRHLVQINRVLVVGGDVVRQALRTLKLGGMKTEPALTQLLNLEGDPYQAVLALEGVDDVEIQARLAWLQVR